MSTIYFFIEALKLRTLLAKSLLFTRTSIAQTCDNLPIPDDGDTFLIFNLWLEYSNQKEYIFFY